MSSLEKNISNLGHFLKGRSALKSLVEQGIKKPDRVVPKLLDVVEKSENKKRKKAIEAYKKITDEIDIYPVLSKVVRVRSTFTYSESQGALSCLSCLDTDDEHYICVGSKDGSVHVLKEDELEWKDSTITGSVSSISISKLSDQVIVAAGTGEAFGDAKESNVHVWNIEGDSLWNGIEPTSWISTLTIGILGKNEVIVGGCGGLQGTDNSVYVWNKEGTLLWSSGDPNSWISKVFVSDIGDEDMIFAASGDYNIYGWNKNGKLIFEGTEANESLVDMTVGEINGEKVVVGVSSNLYVWELNGSLKWVSKISKNWIRSVEIGTFGDQRVIVGGCENGSIYCWNKDGNIVLKEDQASGKINDIIIGNIEEQNVDVIIGSTENGHIYIWEEGPKIKEVTSSKVAREEINEIGFSNEKKGEIAAASGDGNLYFSRYDQLSIESLLSDTEELIPVDDLKKENEALKASVNLKDPMQTAKKHKEFIKLSKKIEKRQWKGEEIINDLRLIMENLNEFEKSDFDVKNLLKKFQKSARLLEKGQIKSCENILNDLLKEVSDIKKEIQMKRKQRTDIIEWISELEIDIKEENLDPQILEDIEPIYEKYQKLQNELLIDEYIGEIREHVGNLKKIMNKYQKISSGKRKSRELVEEIKNGLKEKIEKLVKNRQRLRKLKNNKKHLMITIKDSVSSLVLQSEKKGEWITKKKVKDKIEEMYDEIYKNYIEIRRVSLEIILDVVIEVGYGEDKVFVPRNYRDKKSLKFGFRRIKERFEEELEKKSIWKHVDTKKISNYIKKKDLHSASDLINNFTKILYQFKMASKLEDSFKKDKEFKILGEFVLDEDSKKKILKRAEKEKEKAKRDMSELMQL